MNTKLFNISLVAGALSLGFSSFGQKMNETSAALEYKKYEETFMKMQMTGDLSLLESAKKTLLKAKSFIDLAAENAETKESAKTQFYKGEIYTALIMASADDTTYIKENGEQLLNDGLDAYKKSYVNKKFQADVKQSIGQKKMMFSMAADQLYKTDKFAEAAEVYELQAKLSDVISQVDSVSIFNAGLCYERAEDYKNAAANYSKAAQINYRTPSTYALASTAYRKAGDKESAKKILDEGKGKFPNSKDILFELVNMNIEAGDNAAAEKSLAEAIAADPKNKQLYLTIGTIYIDLKDNKKAEEALNKALEIDPNYTDAQYQLGALLSGIAINMKQEASQLRNGDPRFDKMISEADEYYKRAVGPLEKYIATNPKDKQVLMILSQIYRSLKNPEKAAEYKKRSDEL